MIDQQRPRTFLDLLGEPLDQTVGRVLKYHRLQGKSGSRLVTLKQRASAQAFDCLQRGTSTDARPEVAHDVRERRWLTFYCQPTQHILFDC